MSGLNPNSNGYYQMPNQYTNSIINNVNPIANLNGHNLQPNSQPPSHPRTPDPLTQQQSGGANGGQVKVQPLLCSGHTRPVVHLQFSNLLVKSPPYQDLGADQLQPGRRNVSPHFRL